MHALGRPDKGPGVLGNLLCLCPNHHVQLAHDRLVISTYRSNCNHPIFNRRGKRLVSAEGISEQGHALQAAAIAERDGEPPAIVVAALLHDIGHMLQIPASDIVGMYASDHHEDIGAEWLASLFGPEVSEPVRLHVIAKRYLCATEEGYLEGLSNASIRSLAARGGPLRRANVAMFEVNPYFESALKVRRIDDRAHRQHAPVAPLSAYASHIDSLMLRSAA